MEGLFLRGVAAGVPGAAVTGVVPVLSEDVHGWNERQNGSHLNNLQVS